MRRVLAFILMLVPFMSFSQESDWERFLHKAKMFLDSTDVAGCDLSYVRPYQRPWTFNISIRQFGTNLHTTTKNGSRASLNAGTKSNLKFKLAYRGYGLSYSHELANGTEREFSLSKRGPVYGLEFRRYQSTSFSGSVRGDSSYNVHEPFAYNIEKGSIHKKSYELNGYYVFNHKTFSYPAAITSTVRQVRSCGSPVLGMTFYSTTITASDTLMSYYWDDIRKVRIRQFSIGGGYAYNYVFGHNSCFLLHVSAMPMLSIYRRNKLFTAHSLNNIEEDSFLDIDLYKNYFNSLSDRNNTIKLTALLRASFHYSWKDFIVGYRISSNRTDVGSSSKFRATINDWNGELYWGYRF